MSIGTQLQTSFLSLWLPSVLRNISKRNMLRVINFITKINPGWKDNVSFAAELIEKEHPFYQWIMSMRRDLHPNVFYKFVRNAILFNFVNDHEEDKYVAKYGTTPLTNLLFSVTERCNLKCKGCWAAEYDKKDDLSYELMDRVIKELKEMKAPFVTFTGGEPLIREDILDLVEKHSDVYFQIYTNGTLINEKVADRLQKLGNVAPLISINGFEDENDALRGKGTFQKIVRAFDILKDRGVLYGVSLTATSQNIDTMMDVEFYDFLIEKGVKIGWLFQYMPVGHNPTLDLMISPEARKELGQFIYKLRNSRPIFIADFWNDGFLVNGCMAGARQYVHITNKGDVEPCVFCHFSVDNIKEKSLHDVIRSPFFMDIKSKIPYDGNVLRPCMLIDRPEVFREHYNKHHPKASHPGAETLVTEFAKGLDERSKVVQSILDKVWNEKDFASFFTFDERWFNALPPRGARKEKQEVLEKIS